NNGGSTQLPVEAIGDIEHQVEREIPTCFIRPTTQMAVANSRSWGTQPSGLTLRAAQWFASIVRHGGTLLRSSSRWIYVDAIPVAKGIVELDRKEGDPNKRAALGKIGIAGKVWEPREEG
ncbi:hypothetical protein FOZ63_014072, partial [Perkinsus olseni]